MLRDHKDELDKKNKALEGTITVNKAEIESKKADLDVKITNFMKQFDKECKTLSGP